MKKLALLGVVAMVATAQSAIISFTSGEGFSDGALNGQQGWNAEAGWVVDSTGAGKVATTVNSEIAVLNQAVTLTTGQSYGLSVNFQFGGTVYSTPTAYVYAFLSGLKVGSDATQVATGNASAADANVQIILNTDTYRLLNNFSVITGANNITGTQLNPGDVLQYDYNLTLGADAASTFYTVRLQNLTDGTDTGTGTITGVDATIYAALTGSGAYGFFQTINPSTGASGLAGAQVNSITVIPEPATLGLVAAMGGAVLFIRRRFMM